MWNVGQPVWYTGAEREMKWNVMLFLMAMVVLMLPLASIATPQQTRESEQARDILQEGDYQPISPGERMDGSERFSGSSQKGDAGDQGQDGETDLEEGSPSPDDGGGEQTRDASGRTSFDLPMIPFLGTVLRFVMWIGVALLLLFFVVMIIWIIMRMASVDPQTEEAVDPESEDEEEGETMDRSGMHETLEDADKLAEQGKFTEAIRRMFRDAARRIERDLDVSLKKSETNHEFLERFHASDVRELCLVLVRAVDQFYYGGRPCDESDYRRCRKVWKKVQSRAGT